MAEVLLLFVVLGLIASPGDISGELRGWLVLLLSWPVLSYLAWRGGSPRAALGRSFLFAGIFGLIAVPVLGLRFPGDRIFVLGIAVAASSLLTVAFILLRRTSWSIHVESLLGLEPEQRESRRARRNRPNPSGRGSHPGRSTRLPSATTVGDNHADVHRKQAGLVVAIAASAVGLALQSEPRNVPVLLAAAVALLYGLWLLLGGRATAGRMWGVLVAGGIGGVLGFVPLLDLVGSRARSDIVAEYLSVAGNVGPYAAASGIVFGLMWPEWWWRWGVILSWGFVVAGLVAEGSLSRTMPLLLVPIPCLAAGTGALIRRVVPMLSNR